MLPSTRFRQPSCRLEARLLDEYALEVLCDLRMIKADYRSVGQSDRSSDHYFQIRVIPEKQEVTFDISEENGELFAAELDTLAAIIRARVARTRLLANA
jgi:hypothetical protein